MRNQTAQTLDPARRRRHRLGDGSRSQRRGTKDHPPTDTKQLAKLAARGNPRFQRRFFPETTGFRRYLGVAEFIDETYAKVMGPFLRTLP